MRRLHPPALALAVALALPASPARAADAAPAAAERTAKARAYFTDTVLQDQSGRDVRFYSDVLAGNVVCLSFIYTACGDACPLIMQKLNRVREAMGPQAGEVRFVSLSVDPANDTPAALRAFAAKHRVDGPGFTFLTGPRDSMATVLKKLGEWVEEPGDHSTALVAGNLRTNHWTKIRPDAPPRAVADVLRGLAEEKGPAAAAPVATRNAP